MRSPHPPEYTARGVGVGVFWGITPLVGVQMALVMGHWLLVKWHPKLNFNLILGLAWVWISNVFTIVPMYYSYYITGQVMLGRWESLSGYDSFAKAFDFSAWQADSMWESLVNYLVFIWETFGLPLAIGWIPYAIVCTWIGYKISLEVLIRRRLRLERKRKERAKSAAASAASGD